MKLFLFSLISVLSTVQAAEGEFVRCFANQSEFVQAGRMSLSTSEHYVGATWTDPGVQVTRAFKAVGLISAHEEVVSFTVGWRNESCSKKSLGGWYDCSADVGENVQSFVARYQDSEGVIHERHGAYPKGLKMALRGNIHRWVWTFANEDTVRVAEAELHTCESRD